MRKAIVRNGWIGGMLFYKLIVDTCYFRYINELKNWGNFSNPKLMPIEYITGWGAYVVILLLFHGTLQKMLKKYSFSEFILFALLLLSVVPGLSMYSMAPFEWEYRWLFYLYWGFFFGVARLLLFVPLQGSTMIGRLSPQIAKGGVLFLGAVVVLAVAFVFFYYGGGNFFVSGLQSPEVYVYRDKFSKIALTFPLNYIIANAHIVFLFLLLFFFRNRRFGWAGLIMLAWYMDFSCGVNKICLFSMLAGVFVYVARNYLTISRMLCIAVGIVLIGMGLFEWQANVYVLSFLCRTLFAPNFLSYCYYDFFQSHAPMLYRFWGYSVLDRSKIPFLIGAQYLDNPTTHANTGLLGDAFLMFGVYGVILGPVLWLIYLYVLDRAGNYIEWWMKLAVSVFWAVTMQNGFFATSMLSHGGVALIVLAYLCGEVEKTGDCILCEQDIGVGESE